MSAAYTLCVGCGVGCGVVADAHAQNSARCQTHTRTTRTKKNKKKNRMVVRAFIVRAIPRYTPVAVHTSHVRCRTLLPLPLSVARSPQRVAPCVLLLVCPNGKFRVLEVLEMLARCKASLDAKELLCTVYHESRGVFASSFESFALSVGYLRRTYIHRCMHAANEFKFGAQGLPQRK